MTLEAYPGLYDPLLELDTCSYQVLELRKHPAYATCYCPWRNRVHVNVFFSNSLAHFSAHQIRVSIMYTGLRLLMFS